MIILLGHSVKEIFIAQDTNNPVNYFVQFLDTSIKDGAVRAASLAVF